MAVVVGVPVGRGDHGVDSAGLTAVVPPSIRLIAIFYTKALSPPTEYGDGL